MHSLSLHFYRPLLPFNNLVLLYSPLPPSIPLLIFKTPLLSSFYFILFLVILHHCLCLHVPSFFLLSFITTFGFSIFLSPPLSCSPNFLFLYFPFFNNLLSISLHFSVYYSRIHFPRILSSSSRNSVLHLFLRPPVPVLAPLPTKDHYHPSPAHSADHTQFLSLRLTQGYIHANGVAEDQNIK